MENNGLVKSQYLFKTPSNHINLMDFDNIIVHCARHNASDITLQTDSPIIAEINGLLYHVTNRPLSNNEVGDILNKIYGPNGTTQLLTGADVDTYYEYKPSRVERFRFRVNGTACQVNGHNGMQLTLRTIPIDPPFLSDMNLPEHVLNALKPEEGAVYITGATGSGKSTLLAAIIRDIAEDPNSNRKILTYESPIEFVYDNIDCKSSIISQSEIPRHLPSFAAGIRNALRRKPRLILVGESRDRETIGALLEAALTGHPVYTTLHSNGVAESIRRLVGSFDSAERMGMSIDIVETLRLIIWQKLVPTVDGKRVALREYLVFDENIRDKLLTSSPDNMTSQTRSLLKEFGQPLIVDAKKFYDDGVISDRVFNLIDRMHKSADIDAKNK